MSNRNPHPTKRGPGRKHGQNTSHGSQPIPARKQRQAEFQARQLARFYAGQF